MKKLFILILVIFQNARATNINQFLENREIFVSDTDIQVLSEKNAKYPKENRKTIGTLQSIESKAAYFDQDKTLYDRYRIEVQRARPGAGVVAVSEAMVLDYGKFIDTKLATARFDSTQKLTSRTHCDSHANIDRGLIDNKKIDAKCTTYSKYFCDMYREKSSDMKLVQHQLNSFRFLGRIS